MNEKIVHKKLLNSMFNIMPGEDKIVQKMDLFLCNTNLSNKDKDKFIQLIDEVWLSYMSDRNEDEEVSEDTPG
jgi:hypothetical protein